MFLKGSRRQGSAEQGDIIYTDIPGQFPEAHENLERRAQAASGVQPGQAVRRHNGEMAAFVGWKGESVVALPIRVREGHLRCAYQ